MLKPNGKHEPIKKAELARSASSAFEVSSSIACFNFGVIL